MTDPCHLYFHAPCFDGIISAVLMHEFLSFHRTGETITLHCVNYHLNESWKTTGLEKPCAVVDFLYHPDAQIWFDHHPTTFLDQELENDFRSRHDSMLVYDPTSSSCALLLWRRLGQTFAFRRDHEGKVLAADRIDSARYDSPAEAIFWDTPAMRINASLAIGETEEYAKRLVVELVAQTLEEVAESPEVVQRYRQYEDLRNRGLDRFHAAAYLEDDGIVVFDVDGSDVVISRYAPFLVYPHARYSLGVVRSGARANFTAMRNPWMDFPSVPLGKLFSQFGGGGHDRVASTRLYGEDVHHASQLLQSILQAIRAAVKIPVSRGSR